MKTCWLLLPIVSTSAGFLSQPKPGLFKKNTPIAANPAVAPVAGAKSFSTAPTALARPLLVPTLSYGGLALVAAGAGKLVTAAGYGGATATVMGMSMPLAPLVAIAAPAVIMYVEFRFFGGGERVAVLMGGKPADARLTALAEGVARRAGLAPPAHVFEIPTGELNAFAAGFGRKDATVAVTSGLRQRLSEKELEAVIAHEIGHIRHSDMRTNMHVAVAIAGLGGVYELGRMLVDSDRRSSKDRDKDSGSSVPLGVAMMAAGVASRMVAHMLQLAMSRSAEFDADRVAADLCGTEPMISALERIQQAAQDKKATRRSSSWFSSSKGAEQQPALRSFRGGAFAHAYISDGKSDDERGKPGFWSRMATAFSTHPTTERRIAALRAKGSAGAR